MILKFFAGITILFVAPFFVSAQDIAISSESHTSDQLVLDPEGTVDCFDYYRFNSVQVDISPTHGATVPGTTIGFTGFVRNENSYPVVDGQVYVKIFRKGGDEISVRQNGHTLVDQFALPETFAIAAKAEKPVSFSWKIPENAQSGDYMAAFFFQTSKRYNLLGLSFTDDVTGNQAQFSVKNDQGQGVVEFDKNTVTKNGELHRFATPLTVFAKNEPITIKVKLVNPRNETVVVPVIWKHYAWDSLREETLKDTKTELVQLKPGETKEIAYVANPIDSSASYLVVETKDGNSKSILDIRFARDGVEETRINFPGITGFPLTEGKETSLFSCAHSTNLPVVKNNILTLTLKDMDDNIIHTYEYKGDITGSMMGVKDVFTPDKTYDAFVLSATLKRDGKVVEEVVEKYDCQEIDPGLCFKLQDGVATTNTKSKAVTGFIFGAAVLLFGFLGWRKFWGTMRKKDMSAFSFFFAVLLSISFVFGAPDEATANSISWSCGTTAGVSRVRDMSDHQMISFKSWSVNTNGVYNSNAYRGGVLLPNGSTVAPGDVIVFSVPFLDTDLSWTGTGATWDTPYGSWNSGVAACNSSNRFIGSASSWYSMYAQYIVNRPTPSVSGSGMTCSGLTCTVTGVGSVSATVNFPATSCSVKLEYSERTVFPTTFVCNANPQNYTKTLTPTPTSAPGPTTLTAKSILHTFTSAVPNNAPAAPTINPLSPTGAPSTLIAFTVVSTDPDGDTVRYGIDWDNNGTVDEYAPISGYVSSGTSRPINHSWPTPGTYTFRARTEDSKGAISGWTLKSVTIIAIVNGACGPANTATSGVTFTSAPTIGLCSGGSSTAVSGTGPWSWSCLGSGGGSNASCSAAVTPCNLPWGGTTPSGSSVTAYQLPSVTSPATCTPQTRTCTNGTLSGTYTNQSCVVVPALAIPTVTTPTATAITTTGATLGATVTSLGNPAAISARGTCWGTTTNPTTNCTPAAGLTTGVFTHARTSMLPGTTYYYRGYATNATGRGYSPSASFTTTASSCTLPWGGTTPSGSFVTAYQLPSVTSPATCTSQTRTCTNGTLSGTYTNQSCVVSTKAVSLTPITSTITLGQNTTFSSTASFSDGSMVYHNLNWRKQGSPWNWDVGYTPVASATQSNYTFAATTAHNLSTTLTPTQTGTYDVYSAASANGVTWISSAIATITVAVAPCANGATNPPACNHCAAGYSMYAGTCYANCANGTLNPPLCNLCPGGQTFVSGSCVANCVNGATNPPACNNCPTGQSLVAGVCTVTTV
ncbi:MAG TPA: hypothetical protein DCS20_01525, partial [Candidatus Yonathbacteria bacterium]|nr:hypothetical protein [Candidatus Yonathbacteria bacterium]